MEVSIYELLAAARESAKSDYIKGDSILCEKRFHPDTHYMVEIELLKNDNKLGKKGNYIRKFLTEPEYLPILLFKKETCDISLPRTGWTAAGRGIFYNRLGRNSSVPLAIVV